MSVFVLFLSFSGLGGGAATSGGATSFMGNYTEIKKYNRLTFQFIPIYCYLLLFIPIYRIILFLRVKYLRSLESKGKKQKQIVKSLDSQIFMSSKKRTICSSGKFALNSFWPFCLLTVHKYLCASYNSQICWDT